MAILPSVVLLPLLLVRNPGYMLATILMLMVLVSGAVGLVYRVVAYKSQRWGRWIAGVLVTGLVGLSVWNFWTMPPRVFAYFSTSINSIRAADADRSAFFTTVREQFDPDDTVIFINRDLILLGLRHMQYYLPEFNLYTPTPRSLASGEGVGFWHVRGRAAFEFGSPVAIGPEVRQIIIMGSEANPLSGGYLSFLDEAEYRVGYFDLTDMATRDYIADDSRFQLIND